MGEILPPPIFAVMGEGLAVGDLGPFWPFEKDEVLDRVHVKGREPHSDIGGVIAGSDGEVLASEMLLQAEGAEEIGDEAQVAHFLHRHANECATPVRHGGRLGGRQPLALVPFQAEGRIKIAAQQAVFDLRGFAQARGQALEPVGLYRCQSGSHRVALLCRCAHYRGPSIREVVPLL